MVKAMDQDQSQSITPEEFLDYRARRFDPADKNKDGFLDSSEFTSHKAFRNGDKDKDGRLSRAEYLSIFRPQFSNIDRNEDGLITHEDKK